MIAEASEDRRLLAEIGLASAALWLLGKYLDGFIDGLGGNPAEKLGRWNGELVRRAVRSTVRAMTEALAGKAPMDASQLAAHELSMEASIDAVRAAQAAPAAREQARLVVVRELMDRGVPVSEAENVARKIETEIWRA
jgi:hypothetical protein